jgi:hypothetical protein
MDRNINLDSVMHALQTLEKWDLSQTEKTKLLGSDLFLDVSELGITCELSERCCLIKVIDVSLKICFNSKENIYGYMRMVYYNHPFNGSRSLDLAL